MKNKYKMMDDQVVIYLNCKGEVLECKIDREDFDLVNSYSGTWCGLYQPTNNSYYAIIYHNGTNLRMHRIIMNASKEEVVDHIHHNTLDNRKNQLRVCTFGQNNQNTKGVPKNNTSGFRGVTKMKSGRWRARVKHNEKFHYCGTFNSPEEAGLAAEQKRKELNFLGSGD